MCFGGRRQKGDWARPKGTGKGGRWVLGMAVDGAGWLLFAAVHATTN